ncbi:MAG: methylated-DNA--[protein]-cysteine S-methyltransferase [Anaerolineae bacterium]
MEKPGFSAATNDILWGTLPTPAGPFFVAVNMHGVWRAALGAPPAEFTVSGARAAELQDLLAAVLAWADDYFSGRFVPPAFPLDLRGLTPFQQSVLRAVSAIPVGRVTTYGAIARQLGRPRASRAVGAANGRNPLPVIIPCHRVVGQDGSLRGYGSGAGLATKRWLLAHEGVMLQPLR